MKNLIERYLYDVTKRLPENMRDDVQRELRSNIEDMLPENATEEDIEAILIKLGNPAKLAVRYHPNPRYLIPPEMFDDYFAVLKIVAITLAALLAALAVFKLLFGDDGGSSIGEIIAAVVAGFFNGIFTGIIQAFLWVTVIFSCIAYFGKNKLEEFWSPRNLPEVPKNIKFQIKRSDSIVGTVMSIFFSGLFLVGTLHRPQFIAWYELGRPEIPLFNEQVVYRFLPLFIFIMLFVLLLGILKLIKGRWSIGVAAAHSLYSVLNAVIDIAFITRYDVFNEAFMNRFSEKLSIPQQTLTGHVHTAILVLAVLIAVGALAEVISAVTKTAKSYK